jgi:hypothetical protein
MAVNGLETTEKLARPENYIIDAALLESNEDQNPIRGSGLRKSRTLELPPAAGAKLGLVNVLHVGNEEVA